MTSYVGALQPFNVSNDEWVLYIQRFEHFILANKIENNDEKCHLLLALVGAPTYKVLASLCTKATRQAKIQGHLRYQNKNNKNSRISCLCVPTQLFSSVYIKNNISWT